MLLARNWEVLCRSRWIANQSSARLASSICFGSEGHMKRLLVEVGSIASVRPLAPNAIEIVSDVTPDLLDGLIWAKQVGILGIMLTR